MSDIKSSVRNEQVNDNNNAVDNTDPETPLAEEKAKTKQQANSSLSDKKGKPDDTEDKNSTSDISPHEEEEKPVNEEIEQTLQSEETREDNSKSTTDVKNGSKENSDKESEVSEEKQEPAKQDHPNFGGMDKLDLIKYLTEILNSRPVETIFNEVENIKINYYKKHKADTEKKRKAFIEQGGELENYEAEADPYEKDMKELLRRFKELKYEFNKTQEEVKQINLEQKYKIIEDIKELIQNKESINQTFQDFRELQRRWRAIGPVPQPQVKNLWETYHHNVEAFYDYIRINKELRDLDFKKNLEAKIELCEKAEELLLETNVVEAFRNLQELHEQWREIGPVPSEMRVEIWDRFKEATSKINKKHQEYFVDLKKEQKKNLEAKTILCEKIEELCNLEINTNKEWIARSEEIIELQKVWKTIGFAPKKDNTKIYKRFRDACDTFFNRKREFYGIYKEEQNNNLQLKIDLCVQAESLCESTEWKKTTEELIALQQKWKEIGSVHHKQSEKVWRRFRSACDTFFERKSKHFSEVDNTFVENLEKKKKLIAEIEGFQISDNANECLKQLKKFQRQWAEIGFVPLKNKDEINEKYREAINSKFDSLKIDDHYKNILKFKTKIEDYLEKPNGKQRIRQEREKYITRLKQLESDIVLWENNIGFFAHTRKAETMIKDVESKIETTKKTIELLNKKINIIDDLDD